MNVGDLIKRFRRTPCDPALGCLAQYGNDDDWLVKEAVARNQNTPVYELIDLADDDDWLIKEAVARNQRVNQSGR